MHDAIHSSFSGGPVYNVHANRLIQCLNNTTLKIRNHDDPNKNGMCSGKLLKNVSPVCDTADLHVSTLHPFPGSYKQ